MNCIKEYLTMNLCIFIVQEDMEEQGTIATILLCMLYHISVDDVFEYIQYSHDQRDIIYIYLRMK